MQYGEVYIVNTDAAPWGDTMKGTKKPLRGRVVYVHPQGRFAAGASRFSAGCSRSGTFSVFPDRRTCNPGRSYVK